MTAWYQNTPGRTQQDLICKTLVRFQDCVPPNKKQPRSCQLEQLQSRHGKRNHPLLTLEVIHNRIHSWSSIHMAHMISPCRKETNIYWNKTNLLQQKTCQRNKHPFWNHQFKNLMNLSESILIYIILVTYSFPPPLLIRFIPSAPTHAAIGKVHTSPQVAWNLPQRQEGQLCWTKVDGPKVVWKPISARHGRDQRLYLGNVAEVLGIYRREMCWHMILVYI